METDADRNRKSTCHVRYHTAGKLHACDAGELEVKPRDRVVVDLTPGLCLARVVSCGACREGGEPAKRVLRAASDEDLAREQRNRERGESAYRFCRARIEERRLPMRLVKVEYLFDGSKAIFYFTSEGRVDFRELVKDLTRELNTRVEMRQIGVRDAAKQLGGHGPCGQELCCAAWLVDFNPVSVRMAKDQGLSLNPGKLSGVCGRLKCCLAYEHDTYARLKSLLPKLGARYETEQGVGRVVKLDILGLAFTVALEDGFQVEIRVPQPQTLPPLPPPARNQPRSEPRHKPRERQARPAEPAPSPAGTEGKKIAEDVPDEGEMDETADGDGDSSEEGED